MLATIDWAILIIMTSLVFIIGIAFSKKAGKDLSSFFLGGRNLPWYIAGISMVATTFAADTPLAVTELVAANGIAGNWLWWNFLAGGMLTTFFFANLWRRSGVLTEVELIELRYSGPGAALLRGFKSVYLGFFINVLIMAWVNLALMTLLEGFFGIPPSMSIWYVAAIMSVVAIFSALSGLLGVAFTDAIQFVIAMVGTIVLSIFVVNSETVGGLSGLVEQTPEVALNFFPSIGEVSNGTTLALGVGAFFAYFSMVWWASWYPGAEPGGGGYVAQRMMSTKDEKHAVYATLFFQIAHYCLRPWPWILVALSAGILYTVPKNISNPTLKQEVVQFQEQSKVDWKYFAMEGDALKAAAEKDVVLNTNLAETTAYAKTLQEVASTDVKLQQALTFQESPRYGYVYAIKDYLPKGWLGLLLFAFLAAYMSTISTQLNWGASYLTNDLYVRFINPKSSDGTQVMMARLATVVLMISGLLMTTVINSIAEVWAFLIECGAGLGLVLILRWYWWRINAWAEMAATVTPFIVYSICRFIFNMPTLGEGDPTCFFITVGATTVVWLLVMYFTPPTDEEHLLKFYNKVRPDGMWDPYEHLSNNIKGESKSQLFNLAICWLAAITMTYSFLFLIGKLLFMEWSLAIFWAVLSVLAFFILKIFLSKTRILK